MKAVYQNLSANISRNTQYFCMFKYASRVRHISILGCGSGLSLLTAIAAQPDTIRVYNNSSQDVNQFQDICVQAGIDFEFHVADMSQLKIQPTDLLYLDTVHEGHVKASELRLHAPQVSRYVLVPETYTHAHDPQPGITLPNNTQPCGVIHGINTFIVEFPKWHILEHVYYEPGLTVLCNRRDITDDGR